MPRPKPPARADAHPIAAVGPGGETLTIDIAHVGARDPHRALVVLSALLNRLDQQVLPDDVAIVLVHSVNPWGVAYGRRQNEHNVDLNRNWRRSDREPVHNEAYSELHHLACPDTDSLPNTDDVLPTVADVVAERGEAWVRDGITKGQYEHADGLHFGGFETEHADGLHFGGFETEPSCRILEREIP